MFFVSIGFKFVNPAKCTLRPLRAVPDLQWQLIKGCSGWAIPCIETHRIIAHPRFPRVRTSI